MARFFLVHTDQTPFPELTQEQIEGFKNGWSAIPNVKLITTRVGKKDRRGFCEFEAPDIETLQKAVEKMTGSKWPSDLVASDVAKIV